MPNETGSAVVLPITAPFAILSLAAQLLPDRDRRRIHLPECSYAQVDEPSNRWQAMIRDKRGRKVANVEADLIDHNGDGTSWGYKNATINETPVPGDC